MAWALVWVYVALHKYISHMAKLELKLRRRAEAEGLPVNALKIKSDIATSLNPAWRKLRNPEECAQVRTPSRLAQESSIVLCAWL